MSERVWSVRVRTENQDGVHAHVGNHSVRIGSSVLFGDKPAYPSGLELFAATISSDVLHGFTTVCRRRRFVVDAAEALTTFSLDNSLVALGVIGEEGEPSVVRMEIHLYVSSPHTEEEMWDALREGLLRSPIYNTVRKAIQIELSFRKF